MSTSRLSVAYRDFRFMFGSTKRSLSRMPEIGWSDLRSGEKKQGGFGQYLRFSSTLRGCA